MGGRYPPGTSAGDPNAPWNAPDPPECPECGNLIGDEDSHAEDCPEAGLSPEDLIESDREPSRTWDDVKEDPTEAEAERYDLELPPSRRDDEEGE